MTITHYVYVTQNAPMASGEYELDLWKDFKDVMCANPKSKNETVEEAQKVREAVKIAHPDIPEGKIMKITIEALEEEEEESEEEKSDPFAM